MKFLIFIPPNDFRDESLSTIKMFFDRWNVSYQVTSYSNKECNGMHGATCMPDINANRIDPSGYDGIMFVDGAGVDSYKLQDFRPLLDMIMKFNGSKKYIGAVGNSQKVLAKANIIKGRKMAVPEDAEVKKVVQLFHGIPTDKNMEIDNNLITVKSSGALEESLNPILEHLGVK